MAKGCGCRDAFDGRQQCVRDIQRKAVEQPRTRCELLMARIGRGAVEQIEGVFSQRNLNETI
jgi:hypothetical protein